MPLLDKSWWLWLLLNHMTNTQTVDKQRSNNIGGVTGKGFLPGQSGNPHGRPKNPMSMTALLREILEHDGGKTMRELVEETVRLGKATGLKGQVPALIEIWNRIDGKLIERHMNLNVTTTPELLEQARGMLLSDRQAEDALLETYSQEGKLLTEGES